MEHKLKIRYNYAIDVFEKRKTFEIRKNDRNYQVGDTIEFVLVDAIGQIFDTTLKMPKYKITYIFYGGEYGVDKDYCILSIKKCDI